MWWYPKHDSKWFPGSKPPLLAFFHNAGITHPDDMSGIILSAVWHKLQSKSYDLAAEVVSIQGYWKEQSYSDGKPDTNSF